MVHPAGTGSRTVNGKIMKPILTLLCLVALAACSVDGSSGGPIPSGGSAGSLGPNYCHSVPSSLNERQRWNNLCFGK